MRKSIGTKIVTQKNIVKVTVCDNCQKYLAQEGMYYDPITVIFPFPHPFDSVDGNSEFCSNDCVIQFMLKINQEKGSFQIPTMDSYVLDNYTEDMNEVF